MKKLLFIALVAILASCGTSNEPKQFKISATDMISIKPASGVMLKVKAQNAVNHLTALEIVKQTVEIRTPLFGRSFIKDQRDTVSTTPKLLMWATDVITLDGNLQTDWIQATDVVFVIHPMLSPTPCDTIAYIPNSVLRTAETAIKAAYAAKDIEACYNLFNTAYTFTPITGAEWRALKKLNQQ
jgi:hypothetical protein